MDRIGKKDRWRPLYKPAETLLRNSVDASGFSWNDKRSRQGTESSILTRSCLGSLSGDIDPPGLYVDKWQNFCLCIGCNVPPLEDEEDKFNEREKRRHLSINP
ncbi:hypothetical protein LOK49_LG07G01157 [Camellia lanceoleosa]|uniref:Uncharacterized protein n=1 Tax=Camellia lanceoleosa TaxID=1840588 RepID=A0ACC0H4V0_9ERIC|nr:hypothetical protein LOK49_LG07G01157 [Camellia lanceoleosa]